MLYPAELRGQGSREIRRCEGTDFNILAEASGLSRLKFRV